MKYALLLVALIGSAVEANPVDDYIFDIFDKISNWINPPHDRPTIDMSQIDTNPLATITEKVFFDIEIAG